MTFRVPASWAQRPSPNHSARSAAVSAIILHADAATQIGSSLDWVRRPESKVSYHVMVGRNGSIFHVVHPERKAWHAGVSEMDGVPNVNDFAIGVCLSNSNNGERFPITQLGAAADVCAVLCGHYNISIDRITTHALVATPAGRKSDPKGLDLEAFREMVEARLKPAPRAA